MRVSACFAALFLLGLPDLLEGQAPISEIHEAREAAYAESLAEYRSALQDLMVIDSVWRTENAALERARLRGDGEDVDRLLARLRVLSAERVSAETSVRGASMGLHRDSESLLGHIDVERRMSAALTDDTAREERSRRLAERLGEVEEERYDALAAYWCALDVVVELDLVLVLLDSPANQRCDIDSLRLPRIEDPNYHPGMPFREAQQLRRLYEVQLEEESRFLEELSEQLEELSRRLRRYRGEDEFMADNERFGGNQTGVTSQDPARVGIDGPEDARTLRLRVERLEDLNEILEGRVERLSGILRQLGAARR